MTKRIKLAEYEHFEEVFKASSKLQEIASDYCMESAFFWVDEYLHNFPKKGDYSIDTCGYSYVSFDNCNPEDVIDYLETLQHDYCFFNEEEYAKHIEVLKRYSPVLEDAECGYIEVKEKDYNFMLEKATEAEAYFKETIVKQLLAEYEQFYDVDNLFTYASEMEIFENLYIDEYGDICEDREPLRYDKVDISTGKIIMKEKERHVTFCR